MCASPQRVQLSNLCLRPTLLRSIIHWCRHPRLDHTWAESVDAHSRSGELESDSLRERDDTRFAAGVIRRPGVGAQTGYRGGADDGAAGVWLGGGSGLHGRGRVLGGQEDGDGVCLQGGEELICLDLCKDLRDANDTCICEEDVEAAIFGQGVIDDSLDAFWFTGIELTDVNIDGGVEGGQLALVGCQVRLSEVAEVDGAGTVLSVLMGCCAADADGTVGACDCVRRGT